MQIYLVILSCYDLNAGFADGVEVVRFCLLRFDLGGRPYYGFSGNSSFTGAEYVCAFGWFRFLVDLIVCFNLKAVLYN